MEKISKQECGEMEVRKETIKIYPNVGCSYYLTLEIPANLFTRDAYDEKEEFVEKWLTKSKKDVETWEWKTYQIFVEDFKSQLENLVKEESNFVIKITKEDFENMYQLAKESNNIEQVIKDYIEEMKNGTNKEVVSQDNEMDEDANDVYPYGYECDEMREETIKIFPSIGSAYYITLEIPANLFTHETQAAKEDFVDMWLDDHIINIDDWEWKNPPTYYNIFGYPC